MANASSSEPEPPPVEPDKSDMYRISYDMGLRALDDQRDELNGIRTRAGAYMAFVGSATAFLVGTTLRDAAGANIPFYLMAIGGTLAFGVAIFYMARLLAPGLTFYFRDSPEIIVTDYIESENPELNSKSGFLKSLSLAWEESINDNEESLKPLRRYYRYVIIWGGVSLMIWTSVIWIFGRVGV